MLKWVRDIGIIKHCRRPFGRLFIWDMGVNWEMLFCSMPLICYNGRFIDSDEPVLLAGNAAFKWGEGLFETMKLVEGHILLAGLHWARLKNGLEVLGLNAAALQPVVLENLLVQLALRNSCTEAARLRLQVFAEGAGLGFVAEAQPLAAADWGWEERGWTIGVFDEARKTTDCFSALKSSAYLPYRLASRFAEEHGWDDCLVLNSEGRPCESSKMNLFWLRDGVWFTPPLCEGCIEGVMRGHLLSVLADHHVGVEEAAVTLDELRNAEEICLTNALKGVRWVRQWDERIYAGKKGQEIFMLLQSTF
jgi:branched-chain amino acid aminotransferase